MKLTRIELQDFRCFGHAVFDLLAPEGRKPLSTVLFVGPNGTGKSSVIAAISGFFQQLGGMYGADPLSLDDIRVGKDMAEVAVEWIDRAGENIETFSAAVSIVRRSMRINHKEKVGVYTNPEKFDYKTFQFWRNCAVDPNPIETGLIVLFDVYRLLPPHAVTGPNIREVVKNRIQGSLEPTVRRTGAPQQRFRQLKQWVVNLDFQRAKAKADRNEESATWETLCNALDTIFHPYRFEKVDDRFEVLFRTPTGLVPIEALSDGFRSVFVIVTELLLRLSLTTDDPNRILQQEAVCLIDEIDAHLHPSWQERAIPGLRGLFPNVQFIATTHSPIVVSTVTPSEIFRFEKEEE